MSSEPIIIVAAVIAVLIVAGAFIARRRSARPSAVAAQPAVPPAASPRAEPSTSALVAELTQLQTTAQWDTILRRLDTLLPEWPVSSSLIEVARALGNLEHDLALLPQDAVAGVVIERLQRQTDGVAGHLWRLADQLVLAERMRTPALQQRLQEEDDILLRLLPAIQGAQAELVELTLGGDTSQAFRRAEGRFLALGDTARELQSLSG